MRRFFDVRPHEVAVVAWCWLDIYCVLSSYYIMRPIRDQAGVAGGVQNLQWLFTATLVVMLLLNIPFAYLVKRLPRRRFVAVTYHFFALNILFFGALFHFAEADQAVWVGRVFFVWASVFNLFVVSMFWQLNVDVFSPEQGKRLFGLIAVGATLGAMTGSFITASLARHVPPLGLLVCSAVLLEVAVFAAGRLERRSLEQERPREARQAEAPIGGGVLSGITHVLRSPYLLNLAAFLLLFSITSTFLYFQQAAIVSGAFKDRAAQTEFFGAVDFLVNCLSLVVQLFLTARIVGLLGVALTLAVLPTLTIAGFGVLALVPTLMVVAAFQVVRRAVDYAVARPARELLYTVASREDRYKAKSLIDTVVYRTGDQVGAWSTALLRAVGLGVSQVSLAAIPLAALWLLNALWLGRRQERLAAQQTGAREEAGVTAA